MTPFKSILFALTLSLGSVAFAARPSEVFMRHQQAILTRQGCVFEGLVFGSCAIDSSAKSAFATLRAEEAATLTAKLNILRAVQIQDLAWPEALTVEQRVALESLLMQVLNFSATLSRMSVFFPARVDNIRYAVAVVPEDAVRHLPRWTFEQAKAKLLEETLFFLPGVDLSALVAFHRLYEDVPPEVDRRPWAKMLGKAKFPGGRLTVLPGLAGRYPLTGTGDDGAKAYEEGMTAFRSGEVAAAYEAFLQAVEATFSFDALNMAGNCARRIGKDPEAVALLLHAAYLKPESPYPWIHLAYVALAEGEKALCEQCCVAAEQRSPDTWTLQQLEALRTKLLPPPPPPAPVVDGPLPVAPATPTPEVVPMPAPVPVPAPAVTPATPVEAPQVMPSFHENVIEVPSL